MKVRLEPMEVSAIWPDFLRYARSLCARGFPTLASLMMAARFRLSSSSRARAAPTNAPRDHDLAWGQPTKARPETKDLVKPFSAFPPFKIPARVLRSSWVIGCLASTLAPMPASKCW